MLILPPPWTLPPKPAASSPCTAQLRPWMKKCEYGALADYYRRGKPKYSEVKLSQGHFVHHKFHLDLPGSNPCLM